MNEPAITASDLHFAYPDGTAALQGASFTLEAGRALALVGANGAGKSTLLQLIAGVFFPRRGEIRILGHPLARRTLDSLRRAVGLIFEDPDDQLFMPTVEQDVAFGPLSAGLPRDEVERRVAEALERVGLAHARQRPPYRLSAGEKRAAAIAATLALRPQILLLDEPSAHLDPRARRRLIELLRSLSQTRIIATHDLDLALQVCDEAVLMDSGRCVAHGPAREILTNAELLQAHGL